MRLIAAINVRNELDRYLRVTVPALLEWVDEVRVLDDGSTDGSADYLEGLDRVEVRRREGNLWASDEGALHGELLAWALEGEPTHIFAIDADEIVPAAGLGLRRLISESEAIAFTLRMVEIWGLTPPTMRCDGGWRPHDVAILYRLPEHPLTEEWSIDGRPLASPRVPRRVVSELRRRRAHALPFDVLHLGWARPEERAARYRRYVELDGGRYHAKRHLDSIMWPDRRCLLRSYDGEIPAALLGPPEVFACVR